MNEQFWISIAVYIVTGLVAIARVSFIVGKIESNMVTKKELSEKVVDGDAKISAMFVALDKHKDDCKKEYVQTVVCDKSHRFEQHNFDKLDQDYKDFRHEIRSNTQKIFDLIDGQNFRINELKELIVKLQTK